MTTNVMNKTVIKGIANDEDSSTKILEDLVTILNENIPEAVEAVYKTAEKAVLTIKMTIAPDKDSSTSCTLEIKPSLNKPSLTIKRNARAENNNDIYQLTLFQEV